MLLGIRLRLGLGASILTGAALLGLSFGMSPLELLRAAGEAVQQPTTLYLAAIVGLIMVLSDLLEQTGQSQRLVAAMSGYLRHPRLRLVFFPALIGLLPMPGGAVFSAPMLRGMSKGLALEPEDMVLLNYWFRHVWEFCWPLYPGLILTASLAGVSLGRLILFTAPGSAALLLLGWIFFLRPGVLHLDRVAAESSPVRENAFTVFREGLPLLLAIGLSLGLEGVISAFIPGVAFELGIVAGLLSAILCCGIQNRVGLPMVMNIVCSRHLGRMLLVVLAIFVFKSVLDRAGVVAALAGTGQGTSVIYVAAVLLPLLVGMVGGIAIAFIGATFPLLIGLSQQLGQGEAILPLLALGLFSGFAGVMGSPLHICFILSCQYFNVDLARTWRRLLLPCLGLVLFGLGYFLVLR